LSALILVPSVFAADSDLLQKAKGLGKNKFSQKHVVKMPDL